MSLAFKLAASPLLVAQGVWTRARVPVLPEATGRRDGEVGSGALLRLLILGDSSAAGVGVPRQRQALAGYLPRTLADAARARVRWRLIARSGATTAELLDDLRAASAWRCDIAVVVSGVNDVIAQVPPSRAVQSRQALADALLADGARHVVFAPLPPMHLFPALPQPLRWVLGRDARRHDDALAAWAATRGDVSHVPIALALGIDSMAPDGLHPGEPVYRDCGRALALHAARVVGRSNQGEQPS